MDKIKDAMSDLGNQRRTKQVIKKLGYLPDRVKFTDYLTDALIETPFGREAWAFRESKLSDPKTKMNKALDILRQLHLSQLPSGSENQTSLIKNVVLLAGGAHVENNMQHVRVREVCNLRELKAVIHEKVGVGRNSRGRAGMRYLETLESETAQLLGTQHSSRQLFDNSPVYSLSSRGQADHPIRSVKDGKRPDSLKESNLPRVLGLLESMKKCAYSDTDADQAIVDYIETNTNENSKGDLERLLGVVINVRNAWLREAIREYIRRFNLPNIHSLDEEIEALVSVLDGAAILKVPVASVPTTDDYIRCREMRLSLTEHYHMSGEKLRHIWLEDESSQRSQEVVVYYGVDKPKIPERDIEEVWSILQAVGGIDSLLEKTKNAYINNRNGLTDTVQARDVDADDQDVVKLIKLSSENIFRTEPTIQPANSLRRAFTEALSSNTKNGVIARYNGDDFFVMRYSDNIWEVITDTESGFEWMISRGGTRFPPIIRSSPLCFVWRDLIIDEILDWKVTKVSQLDRLVSEVVGDKLLGQVLPEIVILLGTTRRKIYVKSGCKGCLLQAAGIPLQKDWTARKLRRKFGRKEQLLEIDIPIRTEMKRYLTTDKRVLVLDCQGRVTHELSESGEAKESVVHIHKLEHNSVVNPTFEKSFEGTVSLDG